MKLFSEYLKRHLPVYLTFFLFGIIFLTVFLLYGLPVEAVVYPFFLCAFFGIIITAFDFFKEKKSYDALLKIKSIADVIEAAFPDTKHIESEAYQEIIRLISEEHKVYSESSVKEYSDAVDYYTVWAHQIKTPIASMWLALQNEDTPLSRKLTADLFRIEQYVEMVLTFLRLDSDSTDYVIKEYSIDSIIKSAVKKFSHEFIDKKIRLIYEPSAEKAVTDEKWLSFVVEQIISNALKYTKKGSITISFSNGKLSVSDTGIGISPNDLPRIFENGYTGFNGRADKKASGIGLYLCKRICDNLGHTIIARSELDVGTVITVDLSQKRVALE